MKKLKAFTIIELIVTMIISGIVISMAFTIYFKTSTSFQRYVINAQSINDAMALHVLLRKEFENAENVQFRRGRLEIHKGEHIIYYDFAEEYVIRELKYDADTFWVYTKNLEYERLKSNRLYITTISFTFDLYENLYFPFFVSKEYTNQQLYKFSSKKR